MNNIIVNKCDSHITKRMSVFFILYCMVIITNAVTFLKLVAINMNHCFDLHYTLRIIINYAYVKTASPLIVSLLCCLYMSHDSFPDDIIITNYSYNYYLCVRILGSIILLYRMLTELHMILT